jgi:adenine-specific DNA glycosylase
MSTFFTQQLLYWNQTANHRAMPWKGESDPYKIWLSEVILQQTRVDQGWAYYEKFIQAYPTVKDLAKAKDEKVFKFWGIIIGVEIYYILQDISQILQKEFFQIPMKACLH